MKLAHVVEHLIPKQVIYETSMQDIHITSVEMDSRKVQSGTLFVCLTGYTVDGHQFAQQAVENGAVAILAEKPVHVRVPVILVPDTRRALAYVADRFYQSPTQHLNLIGITGTNGKTSTTFLVDHLLENQGYRTGRMGTVNMKVGQKERTLPNTTPESVELQQAFAQMRDEGCSHAIIEVSSHALHMGRVRGCNFKTAVFTNLSQDHLDYHGNMEEYKKAKGMLFAQLGNRINHDDLKFAIFNADEEASAEYEWQTSAQIIKYGIKNKADVMAKNIELTPQGTTFRVESFKGSEIFQVQMLGLFNVYNLLAAIAVGLTEGLTLQQMKDSLRQVQGVPGRMEPIDRGQPFAVLVDYAHTPDSLENALQTVQQFAGRNIYCIIGCGGDRDRTKRPLMAQIAAQYATTAVYTSDNPRSEDPQSIIDDMTAGLNSSEVSQNNYRTIVNRKEAIEWVVSQAEAKDIVLIAGKGHETYQEIGGEVLDFDDKKVAKEAIDKRFSTK